jgi:hypothetical protein
VGAGLAILKEPDAELWPQFRQLCELTSATNEGRGGIAALEGFSFQFLISLEAMVRASGGADPGSVFLETLSDVAERHGDHVVIAQVKRTLSSSTVGKALEDLWKIDRLARAHTPELQPSLHYKVLGSRRDLADVDRRVGGWRPDGPFDEDALADFRAHLSWECIPDPLTGLAARLVNLFAVADPFGLIEQWLGALLAQPTRGGLAEAAGRIAVQLKGLEAGRREIEGRFRLWSTDDRPPSHVVHEEDRTKAVLTGQLPHRTDLVAGRFAARSIYGDMARQAERWLVEHNRTDRELLAAFWISGRSGTGKSVALLHLLSSLHAEDTRRVVIWLESDSRRIGEAVRWSRPYVAEGYQVIVAADDPFTAARQADLDAALQEARAEVEAMVELHPEALRPVLIFCGPTEQAEAFTYEFGDQVRTGLFTLPLETEKDLDELRDWYRQRTGRGAPLRETAGVLLVQLFFEWATGEKMGAFARSFRRRLEDLVPDAERGPFHLVAEILALNRLYSLFPGGAIEQELERRPDLGAAFDRLEDVDSHFSYVPHLGGYRLTHPHLADAIYRTWFDGPANRRYRKSHLARGIRAAIEHSDVISQKLAPLWAISRLTGTSLPDNAGRIDLIRDELRDCLIEIYDEKFLNTPSPLAELPVWANLDSALSLQLSPSPLSTIVEAVKEAPVETPGLRLACHILMRHHEEAPQALEVVRNLLERQPAWKEWPKVASSYMRRAGLADLSPTLIRYVTERPVESRELVNAVLHRDFMDFGTKGQAVLSAWFQRHGPYLEFQAGFLTDFIDRWGVDEETLRTGMDFLRRFPTHPSWSHVWERLRLADGSSNSELADLGTEWLSDFDHEKRGWGWAWTSFWKSEPERKEELTELALRWLRWTHPADGSWSRVWEILWEADPGDADLRSMGLKWLEEVERSDRSWTFVWEKLWQHECGADDLRKTALAWLRETSRDHPSWTYVWKPLWQNSPGAEDLTETAREWLRDAPPDHSSWVVPWRLIWEREPGDPWLEQRALDWLREAPADHHSWSLPWKLLWEHRPGSEELRRLALEWLPEALGHEFWASVWTLIWSHSAEKGELHQPVPEMSELQQLALEWFDITPAEHLSWRYVWELLWQNEPTDDLRKMALEWLGKVTPDNSQWRFVWGPMWEQQVGAEDLKQAALHWLRTTPRDHPSWKFVWDALRRHEPKSEEIRQIALEWLGEAHAHLAWGSVWTSLWMESPGAPELRRLALDWLENAPPEHPSWRYIWEPLWRHEPGAADVKSAAFRWLRNVSPVNLQWPFVWEAMWELDVGADDLRQTALDWLGGTPDHPSWKYIWESLWKDKPGAEDLQTLALDWLVKSVEHGSWAFVWQVLWSHARFADPEVASLAGQWLEKVNPQHSSWGYVWVDLWRSPDLVESSSAALIQRAVDWMRKGEVSGACWPIVWNLLWRDGHESTETLTRLAGDLLAHHPPKDEGRIRAALERPRGAHRHIDWHWADGWKESWTESAHSPEARQRLFREALDRLAEVDIKLGGWTSVWRMLWDQREMEEGAVERLRACGISWLEAVDPGHPRWAGQWGLLWNDGAADEAGLATAGMKWLETTGARFAWPDVWVALWDKRHRRQALRAVVETGARRLDLLAKPSPEVLSRLQG